MPRNGPLKTGLNKGRTKATAEGTLGHLLVSTPQHPQPTANPRNPLLLLCFSRYRSKEFGVAPTPHSPMQFQGVLKVFQLVHKRRDVPHEVPFQAPIPCRVHQIPGYR